MKPRNCLSTLTLSSPPSTDNMAREENLEHPSDRMEQVNFNYSMKNIPVSSKKDYLIELIHSVEKFVNNLDKRVYAFLNPIEKQHEKETFGFPSTKAPPNCEELDVLKDKLYDIIIGI